MGRNDQGAEDADEKIHQLLTREQAEEYVTRMHAALREIGRDDLISRVEVKYETACIADGRELGWTPAIHDLYLFGYRLANPADDEILMRAAYVAGVPDTVCVECLRVHAGCTEQSHAPDCERQEEWA